MAKETISFKGDKDKWQNFTAEAKRRGLEVWDAMEPFLTTFAKFDNRKINACMTAATKEYETRSIIHRLIYTYETSESDEHFEPIGWRPMVDIGTFTEDSSDVTFSPVLPSLGSRVADMELNYLIQEVLKDPRIQRQSVDTKDITADFLSSKSYEIDSRASILLPVDVWVELRGIRENIHRIEEGNPCTLDGFIKVAKVPRKILHDKIIILDEFSGVWSYKTRYNPETEKTEILHVDIGLVEEGGRVDVFARTMAKLRIMHPERIKILELHRTGEDKNAD